MSSPDVPEPSTTEKAPVYKFVIFCFIWSGLIFTESVSNNLLPYTIETFTASAFIFGAIQAVNPAFGFIAQPIVGVLSDRIWTPVGRRAVFLITGAPIVAVCLALIPSVQTLWHLVVLVIIFQFFQDILWGSDHPLMADLFPPQQRTILAAFLVVTAELTKFVFQKYFLVYLDTDEAYRTVAIIQVFFVAGAAFFLGEKRKSHLKREKLTVKSYIRDIFKDTILRKFAALNFFKMFYLTMIGGFVVRFASDSLGLSRQEFFDKWSVQALISLVLALPAGWAIEKFFPKQWSLVFGYVVAIIGCVLGFMAQTVDDMYVVAYFIGIGIVIDGVARKPFFTEYLPENKIGQLTGAFNIFLGLGRMTALFGGGAIIEFVFGNNYRYCWLLAIISGIITIVVTIAIPDMRYQNRKAKNQGES